jgi:hypothetical protein
MRVAGRDPKYFDYTNAAAARVASSDKHTHTFSLLSVAGPTFLRAGKKKSARHKPNLSFPLSLAFLPR